ncbi:MAG: hypothetical protein U9R06_02790 [Patescibacteria group bacterium]|nr:hypothetical protein [Patescibacteria group bacterium]
MRQPAKNPNNKLVPLRHFKVNGLYSVNYLSLLVQRKKLKAEKKGRNYYTTKDWFNDYLSCHAADDKRQAYQKLINSSEKAAGIKKNKKIKIKIFLTTAFVTAVFLMLIINIILTYRLVNYNSGADSGQVAGEYEENNIASSTDRD